MSNYSYESNSGPKQPPCAYATLHNYNAATPGTQPPVPVPQRTSGGYIVPTYAAPTYAALTHGGTAGSCSGFFTIDNAYRTTGGNCNQKYVKTLCQN